MHWAVWFMTLWCMAILGPMTKVFVVMFEMRSFLCFVSVNLGALFQVAKFVSKSPFSPAAPFSIHWLMCWNVTSENPRPAPHKSETWQSSYCERVKGQKQSKDLCSVISELNLFVCSVFMCLLIWTQWFSFVSYPASLEQLSPRAFWGADPPCPYGNRPVHGTVCCGITLVFSGCAQQYSEWEVRCMCS